MPDFERSYTVLWADLDANRHLRNSAYSDYCSHTRFAYLAEHGLTLERMGELGVGPVLFRESTDYARELRLGDAFTVTFLLSALAPDGSRWRFHHDLYRLEADGQRIRAASHDLSGAFFDLRTRKLTLPPPELKAVVDGLTRTADFEALPARRRT